MSVSVRLGQEKDIPQIKKIADANKNYLGFTIRAILGASMKKAELHVAEINGHIVGFIRWHKRKDGWTTVYELAIDEKYRRKGVGRILIAMLGSGPIKLKCHTANPAIQFYNRLNFKTTGTELSKGGKSLDLMIKE